jgi:hypothetical protein
MPKNLVFFGLHFVIGKRASTLFLFVLKTDGCVGVVVYANSLLISLNTRKELHEMRWSYKSDWDPAVPVLTTDDFTVPYTRSYQYGAVMSLTMTAFLWPLFLCSKILTPFVQSPTSAYRPVFKAHSQLSSNFSQTLTISIQQMTPEVLSPILEFNVERRVERRSDNINSIIQSDYTHSQRYHHPQSPRHMGNHLTSLP